MFSIFSDYTKMKFVAATTPTGTPPNEASPTPPPPPVIVPAKDSEENTGTKDEIDAKVFDFLAVRLSYLPVHMYLKFNCESYYKGLMI